MGVEYDEILKHGLIRYKEREFAIIPPENEIKYNFSEKFAVSKQELSDSSDDNQI